MLRTGKLFVCVAPELEFKLSSVRGIDSGRSAGFTACVGKPFNKKGLAKAIDAALNNEWAAIVEE